MNSIINGIILEAKEEANTAKTIKKIELILYCPKTRRLAIVLVGGKLAETFAGKFFALIIQRAEFCVKGTFAIIDGDLVTLADEITINPKEHLTIPHLPPPHDIGGSTAPAAQKTAVPQTENKAEKKET